MKQTIRSPDSHVLVGKVTSYNVNTYKGRLYVMEERRSVPFELMEGARGRGQVGVITRSQHIHGQNRSDPKAVIRIEAFKLQSSTGRLKRLHVTDVESAA